MKSLDVEKFKVPGVKNRIPTSPLKLKKFNHIMSPKNWTKISCRNKGKLDDEWRNEEMKTVTSDREMVVKDYWPLVLFCK